MDDDMKVIVLMMSVAGEMAAEWGGGGWSDGG